MNITIDRRYKKAAYTIGWLYVEDKRICNVIEDTDRGLKQSMPTAKINQLKLAGITAIPTGTYEVILTYSPKFASRTWGRKYKGKVPLILGVKGFDACRIHPANKASDVEGCVAVGDNTEVGKLTNSTKRYYELMDKYIIPATERGETIWLTIK